MWALRQLPLAIALGSAASSAAQVAVDDPFPILDLQSWKKPKDMTWDDYKPIPGTSWADPTKKGSMRNFNIALVLVDYPDMDFVVTQAANSTVFGNPLPIIPRIDRSDVPSYYRNLLNSPQDLNHNHTLHEFWMENSAGWYGVNLTSFAPYRMPHKSFQYAYGLKDKEGECLEAPCSLRFDALRAWRNAVGNATASTYEMVIIISAGQELQDQALLNSKFGEKMSRNKGILCDASGPPGNGSDQKDWAFSQGDFTSYTAAAGVKPNALRGSSIQAESSGAGTFVHELSHLINGTGVRDDYHLEGYRSRRTPAGFWSLMDEGLANGPGGPHAKWAIPAVQTMGTHHTFRDKLKLGLIGNSSILSLTQRDLKVFGTVVVELTARAVDEGENGLKGLRIDMDTDNSTWCDIFKDLLCDGNHYDAYDIEVIDRIGVDSFTPDSGVMISKIKLDNDNSLLSPFQWVIDANPQDINLEDHTDLNGTHVWVTIADSRQLMDALFHAGTRSRSKFEHIDEANGLHFYVISPRRDDGVLRYSIGVRSLAEKSSAFKTYGVDMGDGRASQTAFSDKVGSCEFELTNNGSYPENLSLPKNRPVQIHDIYKLKAEVNGAGWRVQLQNEIVSVKFGAKAPVTVFVKPGVGAEKEAVVKLTATSESTSSVIAVKECKVHAE